MKLLFVFLFSLQAFAFDPMFSFDQGIYLDFLNAPTGCNETSNSFLDDLTTITNKVSPYKSEWELELYRQKYGHCLSSSDRKRDCYDGLEEIQRRCFAKNVKKHSLTRHEKEALMAISKIYGFPYSLLYCTFFIESRFKPFAVSSGVGAQGLAQLMPTTQDTLKAYFTMPSGKEYKNCQDKNNINYYKKRNMIASLRLCETFKRRARDYQDKWQGMEEYYKSKGIINNSLTPKCDALKPYCAIAVGVSNYYYNLRKIENAFPNLELDLNDFDTLQMLMPTYNAGPGVVFSSDRVKAIQVCQKNNKLISGCVLSKLQKAYNDNPKKFHYLPEPLGYTPGISNCMLKDNNKPPVKGEVSVSCK